MSMFQTEQKGTAGVLNVVPITHEGLDKTVHDIITMDLLSNPFAIHDSNDLPTRTSGSSKAFLNTIAAHSVSAKQVKVSAF